jgi:hypothetical protein
VISAPGTEAPEGSETVPRIAPPDVWAEAATMIEQHVERFQDKLLVVSSPSNSPFANEIP